MLIIGKNKDDKGTQLEILTERILQYKGFRNIVTNHIGSGGHEIDVSAEYLVPGIIPKMIRLICECKAHESTNTTNDWLKFLGKVFTEEAIYSQEVMGYFISLSGVNGNVTGNYNILCTKRSNISLITGDNLSTLIGEIYGVCEIEKITKVIAKHTELKSKYIDFLYYDNAVYWIIGFVDDSYTLLSAKGEFITEDSENILAGIIQSQKIPYTTYINLTKERQAQERKNIIMKSIISILIHEGGMATEEKIIAFNKEMSFSKDEFTSAVQTLGDFSWIKTNDEIIEINYKKVPENHGGFIEIYRFLYSGNVIPVLQLGSSFYDETINIGFLEEILKMQGELTLSEEETKEALELMRISPSALMAFIYPDQFIVQHRTEGVIDEGIDRNDKAYFFRKLYNGIRTDFMKRGLEEYFFDIRGLREIEIIEKMMIKSDKQVVLDLNTKERRAIGQMSEEYGGLYVQVLVLDHTPEPWDSDLNEMKEVRNPEGENGIVG